MEHRLVGDRFVLRGGTAATFTTSSHLARQSLAFGTEFNALLGRLRVAVVGVGGTGSAVVTLLARLGVGSIALIDADIVEETNLNRLHGATLNDAKLQRPKVDVLKDVVDRLGLGTKIITHRGWVSDTTCQGLLKGSHVVFGCTDDNSGRLLLNRFAYYYQIPVIDMGLAIQLTDSEPPQVQAMDGRVTVLTPGEACLLCRGVINPRLASEEALKRNDPAEYALRKSEAYVLGEGNPSPGVVTFTTELACMAVNEMIHRFQGFRGAFGSSPNRMRLFHRMTDLRPGKLPDPECRVCGEMGQFGVGDTLPFLGIV